MDVEQVEVCAATVPPGGYNRTNTLADIRLQITGEQYSSFPMADHV